MALLPSLAILDPINLQSQAADSEFAEVLHKVFADNRRWRVIPRDTLALRFHEYRMNSSVPCHEFQCSFDIGNIASADFVLFGSITSLGNLYAYTLNITHVRSSQVVWSKAGDVMRKQLGDPTAGMQATLAQMAVGLDPQELDTRRGLRRGLLTVLDMSPGGNTYARVMAERVATHLYASRSFDIMSRRELEELLSALEIKKSAFIASDSTILDLGAKMDISHLVYSNLSNRNDHFGLQLALFDIGGKKKMREWPSQSTRDFRKTLEFEDKFFASLFKLSAYDPEAGARAGNRQAWTYGGAGIGIAVSALMGFLAYSAWQDSDREYEKYKGARSRETAISQMGKVQEGERETMIYGSLGAISLAGAGSMFFMAF